MIHYMTRDIRAEIEDYFFAKRIARKLVDETMANHRRDIEELKKKEGLI